jgi:hypothetical protein
MNSAPAPPVARMERSAIRAPRISLRSIRATARASNALARASSPGHGARPNLRSSFLLFLCFLCPYLIPSPSFPSSLLGVAAETFRFPPPRGAGERHRRSGCCEHPVSRAMTGTQAPCFGASRLQKNGNARLAALYRGDFAARARASRCPGFPARSSGNLVRRPGHIARRTGSPGPPRGTAYVPAGDATPRSASRRLMTAPLDERG